MVTWLFFFHCSLSLSLMCIIIFFKDLRIGMLLLIYWRSISILICHVYTVVYSHHAQLRAKHQQHVCVQTETKPARSNQTFAAVSLPRDNDSVNSYHAGSRYLSSSLVFSSMPCEPERIRREVAAHFCRDSAKLREMIVYNTLSLIIKSSKLKYYCHGTNNPMHLNLCAFF